MFFKHNFYGFVWAFFMLILAIAPGSDMPSIHLLPFLTFDKVAHAGQFAILSFFLLNGFKKQHSYSIINYWYARYAMGFCLGYAILLEILHIILDSRTFEWQDILSNIIGCFFGLAAFYLIYRVELR